MSTSVDPRPVEFNSLKLVGKRSASAQARGGVTDVSGVPPTSADFSLFPRRPPYQSADTSYSDSDSSAGLEISIKGRNIRFAPVHTPTYRRRQTIAVLLHSCTIPVFASLFCYLLAIPLLWPFLGLYLLYFIFDKSPFNGNSATRYSPWMRGLSIWKLFNGYFPIHLHKTCDLQPTFTRTEVCGERESNWLKRVVLRQKFQAPYQKLTRTGPRYMLGYHPHGVISMGAFGATATEGAGWSKMFPGIPISLLTLTSQFRVPFHRDYLMSLGCSSVTRLNMMRLVRNHNQSLCLVVGGAQESLLAQPSHNDLVLKRRKGFVKLALELGNVALVPVYAFGENDIYEVNQPEQNSRVWNFQNWVKESFGFTVPLFHARGVFNYSMGLMPFRRRIDVVVGAPILVPFRPSPTRKEVEHYHGLYVDALLEVFNTNKAKYGYPDAVLRLVE